MLKCSKRAQRQKRKRAGTSLSARRSLVCWQALLGQEGGGGRGREGKWGGSSAIDVVKCAWPFAGARASLML